MEKTLQQYWFDFFRKKIATEFNQDVTSIENYQPDIAPIVYCCLQHKRVTPKKRTVILSDEFQKSIWPSSPVWQALKEKIENGVDINEYMSKNIKDWKSIDYLLYTCNITHFHLYKNKDGGIRPELVFGIFKDNFFYALCIGDHNDIYKANMLTEIADRNWQSFSLLKYTEESDVSKIFDARDFKATANNPNLQGNLINPTTFTDEHGTSKSLDNHQNTAIIHLNLNKIDYGKIPLKAYFAYKNEIDFLEKLDTNLYQIHKAKNMSLEVDEPKQQYVIDINLKRQITKKYKIPKQFITCSLYRNFV